VGDPTLELTFATSFCTPNVLFIATLSHKAEMKLKKYSIARWVELQQHLSLAALQLVCSKTNKLLRMGSTSYWFRLMLVNEV